MEYINKTPEFQTFGKRFLQIIDFSLSANLERNYKDISNGIL